MAARARLTILIVALLATGLSGVPAQASTDQLPLGGQTAELDAGSEDDAHTCLTIHLGDRLTTQPGQTLTDIVQATLTDGQYDVRLTSEDEDHAPGYQSAQTQEQWSLEVLDSAGHVLLTTSPIRDLPEDAKTSTERVGQYQITDMAAVRGRHLGEGLNPNSVVAARVDFLSDDCPESPPECPTAEFSGVRLTGRAGREPNVSPFVPVELEDAEYEIILDSTDPAHGSGNQLTQPEERWFLEGVDGNGHTVFTTAPTDDIPDDQLSVTTTVGTVDVNGAVAVRAVHATVGLQFNSVDPVKATFRNSSCERDSGFGLFGPSRLSATAVTDTSVSLVWFPGGGGTGVVTYDVLIDGVEVASGLTELAYEAEGLEPNTEYSFAVRAVDATGETSEQTNLAALKTQSAFRCTVDVVTVEIAAGEVPTDGDDVILGTPGDDDIDGLGGNDIICGLEGSDNIVGGPGDDVIEGGQGDDQIDGGEGNDVLLGQEGADDLKGGIGDDVLFGGAGPDVLAGGPGDDQLYGEADADRLNGDAGADSLSGGGGDDTLVGGEGDDNIAGGAGNDTAFGGGENGIEESGDDAIDGGDGADVLSGSAGDDELLGGEGDDQLDGGAGDDRLVGGAGENSITGGAGADVFVEPKQTFDAGPEDTVEEVADPTLTGGFFDACEDGGYLLFATGERFECNWPWFLFEHAQVPEISFEWGTDLFFDCALSPVVVPGPDPTPQCLRNPSGVGLPDNVEAFSQDETVQRSFQEAYATFRTWGMSRPFDVYFALVPPSAVWPEITTALAFTDDTSFRSRSTRPGVIEYGATAGLTQREITADIFSQFIFGRMIPGSEVYDENEPVLESLTEWAANRVVNNDQPISCTLVTCSRQEALTQRSGTLLWRYMHAESGGYGFVPRLIERLASGLSIDQALTRELGVGWERDFQTATEPAQAELDIVVDNVRPASFEVRWFNDPQAASYEILLDNRLFDEVEPVSGTSDEYFVEAVPNTSYDIQVRALDSFGRVINRDGAAVRTPSFPPLDGFAESAAFTVAVERCVELGGELYLDEGAQADAGQALQPATEIASGCFDFGESECLNQIAASIDSQETVDCDDDVTAALQTFDTQSITPPIAAIGSLALTPVAQVGLACVTQPITSPCAAWAAKNLPRSPAPVAAGGGLRVLPLVGKAGVFLVVTVAAFLAINELLDSGLACGVIFARPAGFDPLNPDFSLYQDPEAMEQVTRCLDVQGASTLYGTMMQTIGAREPDFDWESEGEEWLTKQLRRVCTTGDRTCEENIAVYVPGGTTYQGESHLETGLHISQALDAGPLVWHFPQHIKREVSLASKGAALVPPRSGNRWYNRSWTTQFIPNNPCVPRTPAGRTCDEFPFGSTNQAMYTDITPLPVRERVWASLRAVPRAEQDPQRDELGRFYQECLSIPFNQGEQFIIITPPEAYTAVGGRSFGFRLNPTSLSVEECLN